MLTSKSSTGSMKEVLKEFRKDIQAKHDFDDTQIEQLENKINEFENEIINSKPMMEKLEEEKKIRESNIEKIEQEIEKDSVKEIQLRELENQKEELVSYAKDAIKKIQREVMEEERKVNECKGCFSISSKRGEIEGKLFTLEEELEIITKELVEFEKKKIRFEEQGELANQLELKDGKCPVCDSKVDHLNPLFQKAHLEEEIKTLDVKISQTKEKQGELEDSIEKINVELREAENAEIKLKTHNISTETELEQIAATIKEKIKTKL